MAWDDDKATNDELTSDEWDAHVTDQKNRGYNSLSSVTADHTASAQEIVLADASGGNLTVTLPSPESAASVIVKRTDSSANTVTVATPGSETIDGDSSRTIDSQWVSREITSDGSNYFIV